MRIAYLADPKSNNAFYRARAPMAALEHFRGHDVRPLPTEETRPALAAVRDVDVLFVHRFCDRRAQMLVREAKAVGVAVVWDNDDDMGSMPKSVVTYKHFGGLAWERRLAEMQRIFRVADLVTTPSEALARRFGDAGAPHTAVIENYIPDQYLELDRPKRHGITIGWIAGLEHQMDVQRLPIRAVLQRLLNERPDVHVATVGLGLGLKGPRYDTLQRVPLPELPRQAARFDIAIAPLADLDFNRARSNIKLKEYAAAGTPWLASPIGPYAGMGEQQGGRLVGDDHWYEELVRLIDKPRDRRKLGKRATKWAAGEILSKNLDAWESKLSTAIERARTSGRASPAIS